MVTRCRLLSILSPNRYELYLSVGVVIIGFCYSAVRPQNFSHILVEIGAPVLALVCAINAALDYRRMPVPERLFALAWLIFLLFLVPTVVWAALSGPTYSPR